MRVLVVDDDAGYADMLRRYLVAHGHDVSLQPDSQHAIADLEQDPPDVAVIDALMPGQDGASLLRELAGHDRAAHIPVVLHSAVPHDLATLRELHPRARFVEKGKLSDLLAALLDA